MLTYGATLGMWLAMTAVMMTPVVYPWVRALDRMGRGPKRGRPVAVTPFLAGYGLAWGGFSALAAALQLGLASAGLSQPLTESAPTLSAAGFLLVGAFQFTKLKQSCLSHCRSPAGYFLSHWRAGPVGALTMGLRHGLFCLGCCWALMALAMFVGAMDLRWMAALSVIMLVETNFRSGHRLSRPVGAGLMLGGLVMLLA